MKTRDLIFGIPCQLTATDVFFLKVTPQRFFETVVLTDSLSMSTKTLQHEKAFQGEPTSILVAFSFSSITCFRMVRDDLMASFNVIDCPKNKNRFH